MTMRARALTLGVLVLCAAAGCAKAKAGEGDGEGTKLSPELKALVLDAAPSDIPQPLYIDFNAKAELVGYSLQPASLAAPGTKLSLKLYWRAAGPLEGYTPFTELVTPDGRRFEVTGTGPVRSGDLAPTSWQQGKVYVDELDITVPSDIDAGRFSIVAGLKTEPVAVPEPEPAEADDKKAEKKPESAAPPSFGAVYLSVLSGPADGKRGGVVATLQTGVTASTLRARAAKDEKRAAGGAKRAPGAGKPASAKPRPAPSAR